MEGEKWVEANIAGKNLNFSSNPYEGVIQPDDVSYWNQARAFFEEVYDQYNDPNDSEDEFNLTFEERQRFELLAEKIGNDNASDEELMEYARLSYKDTFGEKVYTREQRARPVWIVFLVLILVCLVVNFAVFNAAKGKDHKSGSTIETEPAHTSRGLN